MVSAMTQAEQLSHLDLLEGRLSALRERAVAFASRRYEPTFILIGEPQVWHIPHPHEEYPSEWSRVFFASMGAAVTLVCFATFVALVKS
jgi:hypothetical protein